MKTIEVDEELYRYIASHTQHIGESASEILRRMLKFSAGQNIPENALLATRTRKGAPAIPEGGITRPLDPVRQIRELMLSDEYAGQKNAVNRFMLILSSLYRIDSDAFADATASLQGRTRIYFAGDEQKLLKSGTHTKPKHVPDTPYWVITNTNTGRKRSMIEHIMLSMQLPQELVEKVCGTI